MKILVTGFDPFGKESINPAIEAVKKLPDKILNVEIIKLEVPTVRYKSLEIIEEAILKNNPDVILSIGQAGGRTGITVERIGINCDDFNIPDNNNTQVIDKKVYNDGPSAYFSNLPIKAMVENIKARGIPSSISNSAGTFVCNHVLYGVQYLIDKKYNGKRSGFIHIPFLPEQVLDKKDKASMSLDMIVDGLIASIEAIILNKGDINIEGDNI